MSAAPINTSALDERLTGLETVRQWKPRVVAKLEALIRGADDYALFRINPIRFATEQGVDEDEAIDLFLHAAKLGLFEMDWHMLCAFCGHIVTSFREFARLHSHFVCDFCGAENDVALDDYIHVSFTCSPQIRPNAFIDPDSLSIEDYYLKYQFARGVIFAGGHPIEEIGALITKHMAYVDPGETIRFDIAAAPGTLQAKDLRNGAIMACALAAAPDGTATRLAIDLERGGFLANGAPTTAATVEFPVAPFHLEMAGEIPSGRIEIAYTNRMQARSAFWLLHLPAGFESDFVTFESFLSGKRTITTQTFRDLFRFETGPATEGIDVRDVTFLFTDLKGSTALYDRIGDLKAYHLVRQHFETLGRVISGNSGAIVKTIGDAVMASFANPADAVNAAVGIFREIAAFNQTVSDDIDLKMGIHRGPAIVVTLNDRLDYFGQTVNIAARVQDLAGGGEIVISRDVLDHPDVEGALAGCNVSAEHANVRGVSDMLEVVRAAVSRPAPAG